MASIQQARPAARLDRQLVADAALLVVTAIWGATFVMVKDAVASIPVFSFLAIRFTFATVALLPLLWARRRRGASATDAASARSGLQTMAAPAESATSAPMAPIRDSAPYGYPTGEIPPRHGGSRAAPLLIGLALFAGYGFQTAGLSLTTPAKAGFITGLSVAIVPVVAALLLRKPPERNAWLGVGLAVAGLALLSLQPDLRAATGDLLVLCCAFSFAGHILLTGHFAPRHDPLRLTFGQITTVAVLSGSAALLGERPLALAGLTPSVLFAAAFTGLLATSLAFGVQTVAQRFTTSTHTALIFAAEPVFAGLFSFLLIGELLGPRQLLGCALILGGMLVAELRPCGR